MKYVCTQHRLTHTHVTIYHMKCKKKTVIQQPAAAETKQHTCLEEQENEWSEERENHLLCEFFSLCVCMRMYLCIACIILFLLVEPITALMVTVCWKEGKEKKCFFFTHKNVCWSESQIIAVDSNTKYIMSKQNSQNTK